MIKSILVHLTWWQLLIATSVVVHGATKVDPKLVVSTTVGNVQGFLKHTFFKNVGYVSYRAIPYAEAPKGDLRFKAPKSKKTSKTVHGSDDKYGDSCIEFPHNAESKKTRSEDCLFLNVFKPVNIKKGTVIFFIHGGSFLRGDGTDSYYGPDFLMEKGDVILVTINYRLHAFGFLRIDDDDITGNMAYKDAQLALRWTHDNIEKFGGDKDSIVVMGQSSGASLAHSLLLNDESASIIKRIAVLSGSGLLLPPHLNKRNHQSLLFKTFAKQLGNKREVDKLKQYLRNASVESILQLGWHGDCDGISRPLWGLSIEKKTDKNPKPFLTKHPRLISNTMNINKEVMFGVTSLEWAAFLQQNDYQRFLQDFNEEKKVTGIQFKDVDYECKKDGFHDALNKASELILDFYFGSKETLPDCNDSRKLFLKLMSDQGHAFPMDLTIQMHSEKSKGDTYYYYFEVDLELNYCKKNNLWSVPGAAHGEDIPYFMFATKLMKIYEKLKSSPEAKKTMAACRFMTDFIVEYAKTGFKGNKHGYKPVSAKSKAVNGILIANDGAKPIVDPDKDAIKVWNKAYDLLRKFISYD